MFLVKIVALSFLPCNFIINALCHNFLCGTSIYTSLCNWRKTIHEICKCKSKTMQHIKFAFLTVSFSCILYMLGNCYILRLPCMLYGEFNIRHDNHFYRGAVEEMKTDLREFDCSMRCINHSSCKFYNYFRHNRTCSLLSSNIYIITKEMLTPMVDASFLSTNYSTYNVSSW